MYWNEKQWVSVLHSIFTHPLSPCFSEGFSSLLLLESNVLLDVSALSYWIFFIVKRRHSFLWNTKTNKCVYACVNNFFTNSAVAILRNYMRLTLCPMQCADTQKVTALKFCSPFHFAWLQLAFCTLQRAQKLTQTHTLALVCLLASKWC